MSRTILIAFGVVVCIGVLALGYAFVDQSTTLQHQNDQLVREHARTQILAELLVELPANPTPDRVMEVLKRSFPDRLAKMEGNEIHVADMIFIFTNGRLAEIRLT